MSWRFVTAQEIVDEEEAQNHVALARDLRALLVSGGSRATVARP
jgi:hypothetical protein